MLKGKCPAMNLFQYNDETLTPVEFLQRITVSERKNKIEAMFFFGNEIIAEFIRQHRLSCNDPLISITTKAGLISESIEGLIRVSSDFVEYSLNIDLPNVSDVIDIPMENNGNIFPHLPYIFWCWAMLHEHVHGVRKHNAVIDKVGNDPITLNAIEHDADMCAIAAVYRYFQLNNPNKISNEVIKQVVLLGIFWSIRSFPNPDSNESHPNIGMRIYFLIVKLAHLGEGVRADVNCSAPHTQRDILILRECFVKCEKHYQSINGSKNCLIQEISDIANNKSYSQTTRRWDQLRELVSNLSGTGA